MCVWIRQSSVAKQITASRTCIVVFWSHLFLTQATTSSAILELDLALSNCTIESAAQVATLMEQSSTKPGMATL